MPLTSRFRCSAVCFERLPTALFACPQMHLMGQQGTYRLVGVTWFGSMLTSCALFLLQYLK